MEIMNQHGIATPKSFVASTPEEADHIFSTMMNKRKLCPLLHCFEISIFLFINYRRLNIYLHNIS